MEKKIFFSEVDYVICSKFLPSLFSGSFPFQMLSYFLLGFSQWKNYTSHPVDIKLGHVISPMEHKWKGPVSPVVRSFKGHCMAQLSLFFPLP